jgi:hypothetical protein
MGVAAALTFCNTPRSVLAQSKCEEKQVRVLRIWLLVVFLPLVTGCFPAGLLSERPLGEVTCLNPEEWNGIWVWHGENKHVLYLRWRVVVAEKGLSALSGGNAPRILEQQEKPAWRVAGDIR